MKALDFSAQLLQAGMHHATKGVNPQEQPSVYIKGVDGIEYPVQVISYKDGRIIINGGTAQ